MRRSKTADGKFRWDTQEGRSRVPAPEEAGPHHYSHGASGASASGSIDAREVVLRTITLLIPQFYEPGEQCHDIVFSGQAMMLALCAATWHFYFPQSRAYLNRVKLLVWAWAIVAMLLLIALRVHYTLDVMLAVYFSITFCSAYHRMAHDVATSHEFVSVLVIDKYVLLPMIEWLERPHAAASKNNVGGVCNSEDDD